MAESDSIAASFEEQAGKRWLDTKSFEEERLLHTDGDLSVKKSKSHSMLLCLVAINFILLLLHLALVWFATTTCDSSEKALNTYCTSLQRVRLITRTKS